MLNSLDKKIVFVFILLGCILLSILFIQIIPQMHQEQKKHTKQQIENVIYLTTQQLKLVTKALQEEGKNKREYKRSIIETTVDNIENSFHGTSIQNAKKYITSAAKNIGCKIAIFDKKNTILYSTSPSLNEEVTYDEGWSLIQNETKTVCPKSPKKIFYTKKVEDLKRSIVVSCNPKVFKDKNMEFEYQLKKDIQNSFLLNKEIHKGKIYLMWINEEDLKNSNKPLYTQTDDPYNNGKYCVSKISNISFPKTGDLTGKQIVEAIDNKPIKHMLEKKALTWIRTVAGDNSRKLLFMMTVFEEDFDIKIDSTFKKILPAAIISFLLVIGIGFFIMRKMFKSINKLSQVAYEVNNGNITVRSNIQGKDDLSILGMTFDKMLDSVEKNIDQLDKKVANRTSELNLLLDEKETLLKEIHHRVKNNFAMTIELIKIQKIKIKDDTTKRALLDIQERIHVMELLHRKLYESKNLSSININKYINELVYDLSNSFLNDKKINVDINIPKNYFLDIEYALPCGLIINECLTNSFKHAFDDACGEIKISLEKNKKFYILKVEDNGKGIDDTIDVAKSKTLGLRLISNIVRGQLLGTMHYSNKQGSLFTIQFQIEQ